MCVCVRMRVCAGVRVCRRVFAFLLQIQKVPIKKAEKKTGTIAKLFLLEILHAAKLTPVYEPTVTFQLEHTRSMQVDRHDKPDCSYQLEGLYVCQLESKRHRKE